MPIVVGEIVQVTHRGLCAGQRIMLVTHWKCLSNAFTGGLLNDLSRVNDAFYNAVAGDYFDTYLKCLGTDYTFSGVRSQVVSPSRSIYVEKVGLNEPGRADVPANTPNLTAVVTRISEGAGRSGVSNSHLGPVPNTHYANGILTNGHIVLINAWGTKFTQIASTAAPIATFSPVIFHRPPAVVTSTDIVAFRTQIEVRDMTRRVVGRGE